MFVRFRKTAHRLQVSLIETRWAAGKVRSEHVAGLGSIHVGHVWTASWQGLSELMQHWSGAVTCPAC
jgi:hypothetical protein